MTITVDNASPNDKALSFLIERLPNIYDGGKHFQFRCFAHILNLIVKRGLKELDDSVQRVTKTSRYDITPEIPMSNKDLEQMVSNMVDVVEERMGVLFEMYKEMCGFDSSSLGMCESMEPEATSPSHGDNDFLNDFYYGNDTSSIESETELQRVSGSNTASGSNARVSGSNTGKTPMVIEELDGTDSSVAGEDSYDSDFDVREEDRIKDVEVFRAKQMAEERVIGDWVKQYAQDDLELFENSNFTFISNRQKGLILALQETFPAAEHIYYLKHIYDNMKLQWRGEQYKDLLWRCATTTTVQREYLMKRIVIVNGVIGKSTGPLTPNATKVFNVIKREAAQYKAVWNERDLKWEIAGMTCKHALAYIWYMEINGLEPGIPESWVHETYWLKTHEEMYSYKINPCNGPDMWPQSNTSITLTLPNYKPPIGRPQKKRGKSAIEIYDGLVKRGRHLQKPHHNLILLATQKKVAPKPTAAATKKKVVPNAKEELSECSQSSIQGDHKHPTMMIEAVASQYLWIWHAFLGLPGANNDLNVVYRSNLFNDVLDNVAPECPFTVNGHTYNRGSYLAYAIYPTWSALVKSYPH
nr:zinc finger BED domain-containing protein RICESLEEPER 2 [Tanacetum cinerariifolium]